MEEKTKCLSRSLSELTFENYVIKKCVSSLKENFSIGLELCFTEDKLMPLVSRKISPELASFLQSKYTIDSCDREKVLSSQTRGSMSLGNAALYSTTCSYNENVGRHSTITSKNSLPMSPLQNSSTLREDVTPFAVSHSPLPCGMLQLSRLELRDQSVQQTRVDHNYILQNNKPEHDYTINTEVRSTLLIPKDIPPSNFCSALSFSEEKKNKQTKGIFPNESSFVLNDIQQESSLFLTSLWNRWSVSNTERISTLSFSFDQKNRNMTSKREHNAYNVSSHADQIHSTSSPKLFTPQEISKGISDTFSSGKNVSDLLGEDLPSCALQTSYVCLSSSAEEEEDAASDAKNSKSRLKGGCHERKTSCISYQNQSTICHDNTETVDHVNYSQNASSLNLDATENGHREEIMKILHDYDESMKSINLGEVGDFYEDDVIGEDNYDDDDDEDEEEDCIYDIGSEHNSLSIANNSNQDDDISLYSSVNNEDQDNDDDRYSKISGSVGSRKLPYERNSSERSDEDSRIGYNHNNFLADESEEGSFEQHPHKKVKLVKEYNSGNMEEDDEEMTCNVKAVGGKMSELQKTILKLHANLINIMGIDPFIKTLSHVLPDDYFQVVKSPMDMATLRKVVQTDSSLTLARYIYFINLIFANACMYNSEEHPLYHKAQNVWREALSLISEFLQVRSMLDA